MPESFPKFADWKAPWELKDEEFDEEKARKRVYDLESDKFKLQSREAVLKTTVTDLETKVADGVKELEAVQAKGNEAAVTELQTKNKELQARLESADLRNLQIEVALDKGLPVKQAKRLSGKSREELEADADEFLEDFGPSGSEHDEDEDGDATEGVARQTPRTKVRNPLDNSGTQNDPHVVNIDAIPRY